MLWKAQIQCLIKIVVSRESHVCHMPSPLPGIKQLNTVGNCRAYMTSFTLYGWAVCSWVLIIAFQVALSLFFAITLLICISMATTFQHSTRYRQSSHAKYHPHTRLAFLCLILPSLLSLPSSLSEVSPVVYLPTSLWINGVAEELTGYVLFSLRLVQPSWASVTLFPYSWSVGKYLFHNILLITLELLS